MPGTTEAITFTDSYKHMECLGGMRLQSFLTNGYFVYPCKKKQTLFTRATPGTPASILIKQVIVCLFVYLSIYLFGYQRPKPQGLAG